MKNWSFPNRWDYLSASTLSLGRSFDDTGQIEQLDLCIVVLEKEIVTTDDKRKQHNKIHI